MAGSGQKKPVQKKLSLYRMIYEEQKERILSRVYANGDMIPCEREMCQEYGVDRITVRRALDLLVADGLLEKRAGLGSFVKLPEIDVAANRNASKNILFVMSKNQNDINSNPQAFNSELFYAIEKEGRQKGYSLFYACMDEQDDLFAITNGNYFAGILFVSYVPKRILDQCVQMKLPAVCLNNRHESILSIVAEDEKGVYEAISLLHGYGHRRIGILLGREGYYSTIERFRGYKAAMIDLGLHIDRRHILNGDWTFDGARNATLAMLDSLPPEERPTALFCCSDMMAIGAMDSIKERNLSIPKDISVMGFDNIQQSVHVYPRLSTVSISVSLMARLAVEKIDTCEKDNFVIIIPGVILQRQSVGEPK